jgi:MATE family multidrug resistance protein
MNQTSTALRLSLHDTCAINPYGLVPFLRWRNESARILLAASPIIVIGLLNMAMSIVDIAMLGRYDPEGLAAALIVSDLYSIVFNFSAGFAGVATQQVAAAIGARVRWQVCTIIRRTLLLVLLLGALGASIIFFSSRILEQLGIGHSGIARDYAALMSGTYVFMLLFALLRAVFSAMGRPGLAVLAIVVAVPVKATANYAFIYGAWGAAELGVAGAGLASLVVAVLMGGSLTAHIFTSPSFAAFEDPQPAPFDVLALWRIARSGILMGLVAVSETGVFLASTIVVGLFAPSELIVHGLTFRLFAICYLFVIAIGQAITIRMAFLHARGAGNLEVHAKRAILSCSLVLVALVLLVLVLGAAPLAQLVASTVETNGGLADHVASLLRIAGLTLAAVIPAHIITALLRAREDVVVPTGLAMTSYWGIAMTAMLLHAAAGHGAQGVWLSLLLGAAASSVCSSAYFWQLPGGRRSDLARAIWRKVQDRSKSGGKPAPAPVAKRPFAHPFHRAIHLHRALIYRQVSQ